MEAKAPTVSIIIPVYNVEKFLRKCLTSLVEQTFQDREIIAVNDGSTDRSWTFCASLSKNMSLSRWSIRKTGACPRRATAV